jgi:RimJ/RimL family protein N-acetyltransferase
MKQAMQVIHYRDVSLRPLAEADLPMTLEWRNNERTRVWFKSTAPVTLEAHRDWFLRYMADPDEAMYVILTKTSRQPIGQVGLYALSAEQKECEGGRLMAAQSGVALGLMSQAVMAICDWGLRRLAIDRVFCEVFSHNIACLRAIRVAGFQKVGVRDDLTLLNLPRAVGVRADSQLQMANAPTLAV